MYNHALKIHFNGQNEDTCMYDVYFNVYYNVHIKQTIISGTSLKKYLSYHKEPVEELFFMININ